MPAEIREVEVPFTARRYYTVVLDAIAAGRSLTEDELVGVRERGAQRALEGFPLNLFVHNWIRGVSVLWEAAVVSTPQAERSGLVGFGSALLRIADQAIGEGTQAYTQARTSIEAEERGETRLVARLLLAGEDATTVAEQAGITLADAYDVMALRLPGGREDPSLAPAAGGVARHRRLLRILADVQRQGPPGILPALDAGGGQVLIPRPSGAGPDIDADRCRRVFETISAVVGSGVSALAWPASSRARVPQAAKEASEWLRVARAAGSGEGFHRADDVALPVQLSRPGAARDRLLAVLDRLDGHPALIPTLEQLLAVNGDRGRTARALGVHPNTVNNRLAKAQRLLGFDPMSTHGILTVAAALAAQRIGDPDHNA